MVEKLVSEFDEEISLLLPQEKEVRLICIGNAPFKWAEKFLINPEIPLKKDYKIFKIPHYSGSNNGGIKRKAEELGVDNYYPEVVKTLLEKFRDEQ